MNRLLQIVWPGPALFLLFWLSLLVGGQRFLRDPGQFWHTRVGDDILKSGFVRTDPYTFTFHGDTWTPYQWLGEVVMALGYRIGGFDTLLVAAVALVAGLYAWLGARFVRTGLHPLFSVSLTLLAVAAAATHFHVRPHLFTMLGMTITLFALLKFESRSLCLRHMAWLIPVYWLWTNIHGGVMGGMATLALAGLGFTASKLIGWNSQLSWRDLFGFTGIALICCFMAFLSPYGLEMVKTWLYINNGMAKLPQIIAEHAPMEIADSKSWPLLALMAIFLVLLASTLRHRPKVSWLLPLFWLAQAFLRVRHGALFAPLALLVMIDLWPHTPFANWLARKRPDAYQPTRQPEHAQVKSIFVTACLCMAVAVVLQVSQQPVPLLGAGCATLDAKLWPTELDDVLLANEPHSQGEPRNVFCEYIYGGYLIHRLPGYRVFVDDRCEVFGDDWLLDYVHADESGTEAAMNAWQKQYGPFNFALTTTTNRDDGFDWYFRTHTTEWELIRRTPTASFYRRKP